jgi:uncharacterized membrane protein YidH (DUF202 family)
VNALKVVALLLILVGILSLVFGGIPYTRTTHDAHVGSFELKVKKQETFNIPLWAGIGAIVVGGALLLTRK